MAAEPGRIEAQLQLMVSDATLEPVKSQLVQAYPEKMPAWIHGVDGLFVND